MKKILLVLIAVALTSGAFAQFSWGIKGGASSNTFELSAATFDSGQSALEAAKEATWGFHGGAFFRLSMLGFMIQPEILFSMSENNITVTDNAVTEVKEQKFNRLDVPLLLGIKLGPARLMAGPVGSVVISSPGDIFSDAENLYKQATFGGQAGIGLDIAKKLTLDVRYEFGLKNFGNEFTLGNETVELDGRSSAIVISAGLMF